MKEIFRPAEAPVYRPPDRKPLEKGDRREGVRYVYSEEARLAVNVALATGRPLLITGPPGCGKSSLAFSVSRDLGWRFYESVISSRTQAQDLLWQFDHLRRLNEARAGGQLGTDLRRYVNPGPLWWAFNRESARRRGDLEADPVVEDPCKDGDERHAVVLLDEIDKADPDVPNNLLVPLGSLEFRVPDIDARVKADHPPLLFITTNNERDLPTAFLRRCIELELTHPARDTLLAIAGNHFGTADFSFSGKQPEDFFREVADRVGWPPEGERPDPDRCPSTAEYLDTVRACLELDVDPASDDYQRIGRVTVWKHGRKKVGRP